MPYEPSFPHCVRDKTFGMTGGWTCSRGTTNHMSETTGGWGSAVARSCEQILRCRSPRSIWMARTCGSTVCRDRLRRPAAQPSRHLRLVHQRLLYSSCSPYALCLLLYSTKTGARTLDIILLAPAFLVAVFASLCPGPSFLLIFAPIILLYHLRIHRAAPGGCRACMCNVFTYACRHSTSRPVFEHEFYMHCET